jgi:hypothetical protein
MRFLDEELGDLASTHLHALLNPANWSFQLPRIKYRWVTWCIYAHRRQASWSATTRTISITLMKSFRLASASMALRCRTKLMSACYTRSMVRGYEGRVAVVTGAANGLGRSLAGGLAARKCHLALIDVDSSALENAAQELRNAESP